MNPCLGSPLNYLLALILEVGVHLRLHQRVGKILKRTSSRNKKNLSSSIKNTQRDLFNLSPCIEFKNEKLTIYFFKIDLRISTPKNSEEMARIS